MPVRKYGNRWQARRQVRFIARDKAEALRFDSLLESAVVEARKKYREGIAGCCSIRSRLGRFLDASARGMGRRKNHYKTVERHRRRLLQFDRAFQGRPLDTITTEQLDRYIKKRLDAGAGADTVNAELSSLKAYARWALKKKHAHDVSDILLVDRVHAPGKLPGKNRRPPKAVAFGEMFGIIGRVGEVRPDMRLFLMGMVHFGARPEHVAGFRREDVTLPRGKDVGRLFLRGLKGEPDGWADIPRGSLRDKWARACLELGGQLGCGRPRAPLVPCIPSMSRRNPGGWTTGAFDMALRRLLARLKIRFTAYQVRHSCMTGLLRRGGLAPANTQGYARHSRIETQNVYNHLLGHEAEPAYAAMEAVIREHGG